MIRVKMPAWPKLPACSMLFFELSMIGAILHCLRNLERDIGLEHWVQRDLAMSARRWDQIPCCYSWGRLGCRFSCLAGFMVVEIKLDCFLCYDNLGFGSSAAETSGQKNTTKRCRSEWWLDEDGLFSLDDEGRAEKQQCAVAASNASQLFFHAGE
ncbi:uncharacterized protein LOC120137666 [Hibiscus syriacus]|uniref:uncharacterized protein LOC120137666 n=1 Tax=Hibiscus syriacus TaxID=106335 RepID=UPI001920801D|nr:uncharacterized protein LOC120137666 [Hibiscus syriacus]